MAPNRGGAGVPWRFEVCAVRERTKTTTQNVREIVLFWVMWRSSVSEGSGKEKGVVASKNLWTA